MKPSRLRCAFGSTPASVRRTVEKAARNPGAGSLPASTVILPKQTILPRRPAARASLRC